MRKSRPKREFQRFLERIRPAELGNSGKKFSIRLLINLHLVKITPSSFIFQGFLSLFFIDFGENWEIWLKERLESFRDT